MSIQDLVLWHASQPSAVPSARFCAMRSLNSPLWGSVWQAVHVLSVEMERQNLVRSSAEAGFVALRAGDGHVGPGQHEMRVSCAWQW